MKIENKMLVAENISSNTKFTIFREIRREILRDAIGRP